MTTVPHAMADAHGKTPQTQVWRIDPDGIMRLKATDVPWLIVPLEDPIGLDVTP